MERKGVWKEKQRIEGKQNNEKRVLARGTVRRRQSKELAYYGHATRKQGSCLEKEIMQGTMPGARRRGRPRTAWMDNIKTWTGLTVEESTRMTEDRDKILMEKVGLCPWCGQPSNRGRLKNRTATSTSLTSTSCQKY